MAQPLPDDPAGAEERLGTPLPEAVRDRVAVLAADALGELSADETPPALRAFLKFTPARRARLAATPAAAAVEVDEGFRRRVAARVRLGAPHLAEAVEAGVVPAAADPRDVAAVAYLLRPAGWTSYVGQAVAELERQAEQRTSAQAQAVIEELQEQLAALRGRGREDDGRLRAELDAAKDEVVALRRKLRAARAERAAARADVERLTGELERAAAEVSATTEAAETEARRLRSRLTEAEHAVESTRRAAREGRSLDEARLRLLLDTVVDAASGLRRELALPPVDLRPADVVEAVRPEGMGPGDVAARAHDADDPRLLDQLLALPQVHLVVDGYNVTKTGFGDLPLETQRRRLVSGLGVVAAQTGAEVTCCFDGAALDTRVVAAAPRGVRVLFSQPGETADELIRRLVRAEPPGRAVVVVSSDREVADGVRRSGARPVPATALLRRLGRS